MNIIFKSYLNALRLTYNKLVFEDLLGIVDSYTVHHEIFETIAHQVFLIVFHKS